VSDGASQGESPDEAIARALLESYRGDPRGQQLSRAFMPSRAGILVALEQLLPLLYPGYFGQLDLRREDLDAHVSESVSALRVTLESQIERCLCYQDETIDLDVPRCREHGREVAATLLSKLPAIRARLLLDVQAAVDGDPAATSLDEILLSYPGLYAVTVHRIAHELHHLGVPLMPRILSEHAHTQTGCDIHPGATIGDRFFIDHATGVVVGATAIIGARVKLYQGVTLGALSMPKDAGGNLIRNTKRHPTVEDDVTIYANATVLGGDTVIGKGSVIGGGVFLTKSVAPGTKVALESPRLRVGSKIDLDFEI
jgi:serine O-acetyltransferase